MVICNIFFASKAFRLKEPKALNFWSSKHHYASIFGRVVTKVNKVKIFTAVYHSSHSLNERHSALPLVPKVSRKVSFSKFINKTSKLTVYFKILSLLLSSLSKSSPNTLSENILFLISALLSNVEYFRTSI